MERENPATRGSLLRLLRRDFLHMPSIRVYVDAKIIGRDNPTGPKRTLVGYIVEGREEYQGVCEVNAEQTHEAEFQAVAFAIRELSQKLGQFTVLCDHQSVVSEANRKPTKAEKVLPVLRIVRDELEANSGIKVEWLRKNPAHKLLNEYSKKTSTSTG